MRVEGDRAATCDTVRLDDFKPINQGPLVMADDTTGQVQWLNNEGKICEWQPAQLGKGYIAIVSRARS